MTNQLKLERLPENNLELPKYATTWSGGIDFAACLSRPCIAIREDASKISFLTLEQVGQPMRRRLDDGEEWKHVADEYACENPILLIRPSEIILVPLGFKTQFENGHILQLHVRSSIGLSGLSLANGTGIIDSDYRGELFAALFNRTNYVIKIEHGKRIVQGILLKYERSEIIADTVDDTVRGEGGFGSTGSK